MNCLRRFRAGMVNRMNIIHRILPFVFLILSLACPVRSEDLSAAPGIPAKVSTQKGALNMRAQPGDRAKVTAKIPNGSYVLVTEAGEEWCRVQWDARDGYCRSDFLELQIDMDPTILNYRVLSKGDRGEDVLALKARLQELGYIRGGTKLTNVYNDTLVERLKLFQRQAGMEEDGIASPEVQARLFSDRAPVCAETLPKAKRTQVISGETENRIFCGCCFGEGCECCHFTGWIYY